MDIQAKASAAAKEITEAVRIATLMKMPSKAGTEAEWNETKSQVEKCILRHFSEQE